MQGEFTLLPVCRHQVSSRLMLNVLQHQCAGAATEGGQGATAEDAGGACCTADAGAAAN